jgi:hypothetical protein
MNSRVCHVLILAALVCHVLILTVRVCQRCSLSRERGVGADKNNKSQEEIT